MRHTHFGKTFILAPAMPRARAVEPGRALALSAVLVLAFAYLAAFIVALAPWR